MKSLIKYEFFNNQTVRLHFSNGRVQNVSLNNSSGKIIGREKKEKFISVTHTGIMLGICMGCKDELVIHNHPKNKQATVVSMDEFRD